MCLQFIGDTKKMIELIFLESTILSQSSFLGLDDYWLDYLVLYCLILSLCSYILSCIIKMRGNRDKIGEGIYRIGNPGKYKKERSSK